MNVLTLDAPRLATLRRREFGVFLGNWAGIYAPGGAAPAVAS